LILFLCSNLQPASHLHFRFLNPEAATGGSIVVPDGAKTQRWSNVFFFCFDFAVCQMFCKESYTVGQASEFASNFRQHFRRLEHQEWLACGCSNDPYVGDAQRQAAQLWQTA
jgi:hypothetical protein